MRLKNPILKCKRYRLPKYYAIISTDLFGSLIKENKIVKIKPLENGGTHSPLINKLKNLFSTIPKEPKITIPDTELNTPTSTLTIKTDVTANSFFVETRTPTKKELAERRGALTPEQREEWVNYQGKYWSS